ncbi:PAS domain S-box protein [Candidatus Nitrospira bockiana]
MGVSIAREAFPRLVGRVAGYAMVIVDPEGRIATWNLGAERMTGYTETEILGQPIARLYPDEDIATGKPDRVLRAAEREGRFEEEGWRIRKDGSRFWADVAVTPIREDDGTLLGYLKITKDLSERYRAEERLRLTVEASPSGMVMVDQRGTILLVNHQLEQQFGYEREELIGQSIEVLVPAKFQSSHPTDRSRYVHSPSARPMGHGRDLYGVRKDGSEFPVEIGLNPVRTTEGLLVLASVVDITERKRAEEALRESERVHKTLLSNLSGMAYRCRNDKDRTMELVSDGCLQLTGYHPAELVTGRSRSFGDLIHPEDRQTVWESFQKSLVEKRPFSMEYRIVAADGSTKWVWDQAQGVFSPSGELLAVEGFITDVTERRQAEAALKLSEARFKAFMDNSPAVAFLKDEQGRYLYVNRPFELRFKKSEQDWRGKTDDELWPPETAAQFRRNDREALEATDPIEGIEAVAGPDGEVQHWLVLKFPVPDASGGRYLGGVAVEVTERKRLEEQLRRTERLAELGTLASGMAHEIGTPMNVILGRAEHLMQRAADERTKKGLEIIITQVERITKIMNQLLTFARRRPTDRRPADLRQIIADTLEVVHERTSRHRIRIETRYQEPLPLASVDPDQMSQVLLNLIINAIHAMPNGGILTLGLARHDRSLTLTVADTGHGIPQADLGRIFNPFFTTKEVGKGTGLGLTVVHGIVQEHGGSIEVASEEGRGTTFTITLPIDGAS